MLDLNIKNAIFVEYFWVRGVGHDHVHHEALTEIFLLNIVMLSVESD